MASASHLAGALYNWYELQQMYKRRGHPVKFEPQSSNGRRARIRAACAIVGTCSPEKGFCGTVGAPRLRGALGVFHLTARPGAPGRRLLSSRIPCSLPASPSARGSPAVLPEHPASQCGLGGGGRGHVQGKPSAAEGGEGQREGEHVFPNLVKNLKSVPLWFLRGAWWLPQRTGGHASCAEGTCVFINRPVSRAALRM